MQTKPPQQQQQLKKEEEEFQAPNEPEFQPKGVAVAHAHFCPSRIQRPKKSAFNYSDSSQSFIIVDGLSSEMFISFISPSPTAKKMIAQVALKFHRRKRMSSNKSTTQTKSNNIVRDEIVQVELPNSFRLLNDDQVTVVLCIFLPHTEHACYITVSLSIRNALSPPSIHPSILFSFILVSHTSPCFVFLGFRLFYNPLHISARASAHTHRGVGLQLCPVVWPAAAAASSKRIHTFCLACVTSYKREEREKRKIQHWTIVQQRRVVARS